MKSLFAALCAMCLIVEFVSSVHAQQTDADQKYLEAKTKQAQQGDAQAQCELGLIHELGLRGISTNLEEAVKWYRKAADQNLADAQFHLGMCYSQGHGVARDGKSGMNLIRKAAEQGQAEAQFMVGKQYCFSNDYAEGVKWLRKAAEQNFAKAQYKLGDCYWLGSGVPKDKVEAYKWCYLAAKQGDEDAKRILPLVIAAPRITLEQMDEANRQIDEFQKQQEAKARTTKTTGK